MKIDIRKTLSFEFEDIKWEELNELALLFSKHFEKRCYSKDVEMCEIYIICVSPGFDQFFIPKRPTYHKDKTYANGLHFIKTFLFDIKLDYQSFYQSNKIEGYAIIGNTLLKYLEEMKYPIAIRKSFDKERFNKDVREFFQSLGCKLI